MKIEAQCTWGEGPDVLLTNKGLGYVLYDIPDKSRWTHGLSREGSLDLTKEEARSLAAQLLYAVNVCDDMDSMCEQHEGQRFN